MLATLLRRMLTALFPNPNALVAISKGMRQVKLCSNKILQFFKPRSGLVNQNLVSINYIRQSSFLFLIS